MKIFGHTEMQEFLAFSSPEMRFLVDSSSYSNKSLTNAKVEHLWDNSFSWKLFFTPLLPQNKLTGTTERLDSWYCTKLDQPRLN